MGPATRAILISAAFTLAVVLAVAWDRTRSPVICAPPGWRTDWVGPHWLSHGRECFYLRSNTLIRWLHPEERP